MNILFHNLLEALSIMSLIVIVGIAYSAFLYAFYALLDAVERRWLK